MNIRILTHGVDFVHWGVRGRLPVAVPSHVRFDQDGDETVIGAICRAVTRASRPLEVVRRRLDGSSRDRHGRLLSEHDHVTLGWRPTPEVVQLDAGLWLAVDYDAADRAARGQHGAEVPRTHPVFSRIAATLRAGDGL